MSVISWLIHKELLIHHYQIAMWKRDVGRFGVIEIRQVEAGGRGGAQQRRDVLEMAFLLLNLFMDEFELSASRCLSRFCCSCSFPSVSSRSFSKSSAFVDSFCFVFAGYLPSLSWWTSKSGFSSRSAHFCLLSSRASLVLPSRVTWFIIAPLILSSFSAWTSLSFSTQLNSFTSLNDFIRFKLKADFLW